MQHWASSFGFEKTMKSGPVTRLDDDGSSARYIVAKSLPPFGDCVSLVPGEDENNTPSASRQL
jgi:hypothetical protein